MKGDFILSKTNLRCPICRDQVHLYEPVNLDIINTVTHQHCKTKQEIKDSATFRVIMKKYPFFKSV